MAQPGLEQWQVNDRDFPREGSLADQLRFALRYALLAPSAHNTQPWLFRLRKDAIELYADRTRALAVVDPDDRELTIACGAALFNLRLAMRRFGRRCDTVPHPEPDDPDLLASVRPGKPGPPSSEELALFDALPLRRTNRRPFSARPLDEALLGALSAAAAAEGAWLVIVREPEGRRAVAELVAEGDRAQGSDARFRREMAAWTHPHRSRSRDGLPGYGYGSGDLAQFVGPTVLRTFEADHGRPASGPEVAVGSPVLAVLGTGGDAPDAWVCAGQALERVLLRARVDGVHASYLNQPVEVPGLRRRLREALGLTGPPQTVLRLGYGPDVPPTPRRPLEDVLLP